ncbi:MAG: pyridoxine 5'-phosphate synthase [Crocinitomicaceae bacterium]|nr:pyridoxine 5'-phosphate synthase [Crocinitomicaceae bacterium]
MSDKAKLHTTKLSVNVNKIATLRNARGGSIPNVLLAAERIEKFGAQGITVHPRPDARHITYEDVRGLKKVVETEFNIEGYPNDSFINLVLEVVPEQVTLVPDPPDVLTSNAGWNAIENAELLKEVISRFKSAGIRTSIFMDTDEDQIHAGANTGTDRIELYTEAYAVGHKSSGAEAAIAYARAATLAHSLGMGVNAGHDLDLTNLRDFAQNVPHLAEVSIGHALISDALYLGLEETVKQYLECLK